MCFVTIMEYKMSMIAQLTATTPLGKFPMNGLIEELPGVVFVERIWIDFDNIVVDPDDNIFRAGGNNLTNQNNLKISFSNGIFTTENLPVVERLKVPFISEKKGFGKDFILRDGFNRVNALRALGYTGYAFDVLSFNSDATRASFSARSNRFPPRASSSDKDMKHMVLNLVNKEVITNDFDEMVEWLRENCGIRSDRAARLIKEISNENGQGIVIYSTAQIKDLAHDLGIEVGGKYDLIRGQTGYHIRSMYEGRTLQKILRSFRISDGKTSSYATLCTRNLPDEGYTIEDQRDDIVDNLLEYEADLDFYAAWKKKNPGKTCWEILGSLPQTKEERSKKSLLSAPSNVVQFKTTNSKKKSKKVKTLNDFLEGEDEI